MQEGVALPSGGTIQILIRDRKAKVRCKNADQVLSDPAKTDNQIIRTALYAQETMDPPVILVSNDSNVQLKARLCGLIAQEYLNERVEQQDEESHATVDITDAELQAFASSGRGSFVAADLALNEYVLLRGASGATMPARAISKTELVRLNSQDHLNISGGKTIRPRNLEQQFLVDAMLNPRISLVACSGKAGTGKTLLAVATAVSQVLGEGTNRDRVMISRPVMALGKDIGFLPGTMEEKLRPYLAPYYDALEFIFAPRKVDEQFENKRVSKRHSQAAPLTPQQGGAMKPQDRLIASGVIQIEALTYIRGRSIPRSIFIVDEAQNLTRHEIKTIASRMSSDSQLILLGDPAQIDHPALDSRSNGLVHVMTKMRGLPYVACVHLEKGERSELADGAAEFL